MSVNEGSWSDDSCGAKDPQAQQVVVPGDDEVGRSGLGALQDAVVIRVIANLYGNGGYHNDTSLPKRRQETL
jgi:hypothetical protein